MSNYVPMQLPYDVCDLEGFLSCKNLRNHYELYLNYVKDFNELRDEYPAYAELSPREILENPWLLPWQIRTEFLDAAGGIFNHEIIFSSMTHKTTTPGATLRNEIGGSFGSPENMKQQFKNAANSHSGSGYVSLVKNPSGSLSVISMPNEESSVIDRMNPILMVDIWEHAYSLDFFEQENYIDKWFDYIDWEYAGDNYDRY